MSDTFSSPDPVNAKTLAESTTQYDALGRTVASTTWLVERGTIDVEDPPIAGYGSVSPSDGMTTQYLYDNNLNDGVGLDSTAGVSYTKMAGTGSGTVKLSNAITKLGIKTVSDTFSSPTESWKKCKPSIRGCARLSPNGERWANPNLLQGFLTST